MHGRFQPLHVGHVAHDRHSLRFAQRAAMVRAVFPNADRVLIAPSTAPADDARVG
jgi:nicotinamide mononucleotide adenylyltransferase